MYAASRKYLFLGVSAVHTKIDHLSVMIGGAAKIDEKLFKFNNSLTAGSIGEK